MSQESKPLTAIDIVLATMISLIMAGFVVQQFV